MEKILVSACLLGIPCRYDGKNAESRLLKKILKDKYVIFACPEQLGGLPTPRPKNRIIGEKVINELGEDVTKKFYHGAKEFLKITRRFKVRKLYLKSNSPSCGKNGIVSRLLPKKIKLVYL